MPELSPGQFGDYELRHRTEDMGERKLRNIIEAVHGGEPVGKLNWRATSGYVDRIDVHKAHRRQGLATAMWNYANALPGVKSPLHAKKADRTPDGNAWVKAVGGRGTRS